MGALADFLHQRRDALIEAWVRAAKAELPSERALTTQEAMNSFHLFLDEVVEELRRERGYLMPGDVSSMAAEHGSQRFVLARPLGDVIQEYGILFQVILVETGRAGVTITQEELLGLDRCLFSGAAGAARQYTREREEELRRHDNQYFAFVAHELRNPLSSVRLAWELLRRHLSGGSQRAVDTMGRGLDELSRLIDDTLVELKLRAVSGTQGLQSERIALGTLLDDVRRESIINAETRQMRVEVELVDPTLELECDPRLLRSALSNVVRNGIKFSKPGTRIVLRGLRDGDRVRIEVADGCGGLPPDRIESLFGAFSQAGPDRSGFGLGLAIAKQAIEAHDGTITVRNDPPRGCVFVIALPG